MNTLDKYEAVIGLEVHARLLTESKLFSSEPNSFGVEANTNISPVTLAHPGTLPFLNEKVIEKAILLKPDFPVMQGLLKTKQVLEDARRSPLAADFGRLRALVTQHAERPATRTVIGNATRLEEDILSWLKVQEAISVHLRMLSEIAGDNLRISQE